MYGKGSLTYLQQKVFKKLTPDSCNCPLKKLPRIDYLGSPWVNGYLEIKLTETVKISRVLGSKIKTIRLVFYVLQLIDKVKLWNKKFRKNFGVTFCQKLPLIKSGCLYKASGLPQQSANWGWSFIFFMNFQAKYSESEGPRFSWLTFSCILLKWVTTPIFCLAQNCHQNSQLMAKLENWVQKNCDKLSLVIPYG